MGNDILPGHTYTDGQTINGPSLTEHVGEATIKETFYSSRTAKAPAQSIDQMLVLDTVANQYRKVTLQTLQALMVGSGTVIQTSYAEYTANTNLTTVIPFDDTIPQNTEGTEIVTATITPAFDTSRILVSFTGMAATSTPGWTIAALFKDSAAAALAANTVYVDTVSGGVNLAINYLDSPAATSAKTYRIRVGPQTGTMRMNGSISTRLFGGVMRSTLTLQEIK